jgi:histidine triad (HIT) family protein
LLDMTVDEMGQAMHVARRVAVAQQRALGSTGFTILQNNGRDQAVGHVHFHVIPDTPREPRVDVAREVLDAMAQRLAAAFPSL